MRSTRGVFHAVGQFVLKQVPRMTNRYPWILMNMMKMRIGEEIPRLTDQILKRTTILMMKIGINSNSK